jgi:hypothetical protein
MALRLVKESQIPQLHGFERGHVLGLMADKTLGKTGKSGISEIILDKISLEQIQGCIVDGYVHGKSC